MCQAKQLAEIHRQSFPTSHAWSERSFAELLQQDVVELYMEQENFLLIRIAADEMEILTIAVLPENRRQGIATNMMQQALRDAKASDVTSCFLEVDKNNEPAIRLYEHLGFEVIATRKNYYQTEEGKSDGLVMRYHFVT